MRIKTIDQYPSRDVVKMLHVVMQGLIRGDVTVNQLEWFSSLSFTDREKLLESQFINEGVLRLISGRQTLIIDAVDGTQIITKAHDVFPVGIDDAFYDWELNKPEDATAPELVDVYEISTPANYKNIFNSFRGGIKNLRLTQHQIINFCRRHFKWLRQDAYATFLVLKREEDGQFFVACVHGHDERLSIQVDELDNNFVWPEGFRLVVPQQFA